MVKMEIEIWDFLYQNWQNIIVASTIGLLFFFLSNYTLKRFIISAERERLKQAKDTVLSILESRIINKQDISLDNINNLLKAIDREHSVILSDLISPSSLLQDLELQFEKSHHLDSNQKEEYCTQIQNQIQEIRKIDESLFVPTKYSEIIDNLAKEIRLKNTEKSLEILELLKKMIIEREERIGGIGSITMPTPYFALLISLIYFSLKLLNLGFLEAIMISFFITLVAMLFNSFIMDLLNIILKRKK